MTPQEILQQIDRLPLTEQREISDLLSRNLTTNNRNNPDELDVVYRNFQKQLVAEGFLTQIPTGMTDEEDDFEPMEFAGEPISETIIKERR